MRVHDASENLGPLFGGSLPRIHLTNGSWGDVGTIVLGVEGSGTERWKMSFQPNPALGEQEMPPEIVSRKAGWYFIRFYDLNDELIDSLDFRFVSGLRQIVSYQRSPFPSANGHAATVVEFLHDADCYVEHMPPTPADVKKERTNEKTILTVPPVPVCDRSRWLLGPRDGPQIEVSILIQRIWWAVSKISEPPLQWQDTCLCLSSEDFIATSERALWLRLPKPRWTDGVWVGFQQGRERRYELKVAESTLAIPLREFSDSPELVDRSNEKSLRIRVNVNGTFHDAAAAIIPAEVIDNAIDITCVSASHLARILTALTHLSRGSLRQLLKEVRRRYRGSRSSLAGHNLEFLKEALCVMAVFLQLTELGQHAPRKLTTRWRSKVQFVGREYPNAARQVWRRYRELEKQKGIRQ